MCCSMFYNSNSDSGSSSESETAVPQLHMQIKKKNFLNIICMYVLNVSGEGGIYSKLQVYIWACVEDMPYNWIQSVIKLFF